MCDQEYKAGVVYLDNAATTRMAEEAEAAMQPYLVEKFGNASTAYGYGEEAQAAIAHAREVIAASLDRRKSILHRADRRRTTGQLRGWRKRMENTVVISLPAGLNITRS